jgi:hypothetical protein
MIRKPRRIAPSPDIPGIGITGTNYRTHALYGLSEDVSRVDVLFVGWVGLAVLAGGLRARLWVWLSEQPGLGLDEDAAADQSF